MFTHHDIWSAIDALAARYGMSASGLARRAGLDATTFNKSKRVAADGRQRWPNTESLAKVLDATGASLEDFLGLVGDPAAQRRSATQLVPLIGLAQAGHGGIFDDAGFPVGGGWDEVEFPHVGDENAYALEIAGDSMMPVYRDGDTIIVSPNAGVRRGDRVVVKTRGGEVMAKLLVRQTARTVELASFNPEHETRAIELADIEWMARIVWASQ
jgi:phage repressor protein C with HTH and peptisase S24 domain